MKYEYPNSIEKLRVKSFRRLATETLEDRRLLASILVNDTSDMVDRVRDSVCDVDPQIEGDQCNLRAAVATANATDGPDDISFSGISTIDMGQFGRERFEGQVTIDGGNSVEIQGELSFRDTGSTIRNIAVWRITLAGEGGHVVDAVKIGTDISGSNSRGQRDGLVVSSDENVVKNSVVSGIEGVGISVTGSKNTIENNLVGVTAAGTAALPNRTGVNVTGSENHVLNNVISGNNSGLSINGEQNAAHGNFIGTDRSEASIIPNGTGMSVRGTDHSIGGLGANVIVNSTRTGLTVPGDNNLIEGNYIGRNRADTLMYNNVSITGSNNTFGGTAPGKGNTLVGMLIQQGTGNRILGNLAYSTPAGFGGVPGPVGIALTGRGNNQQAAPQLLEIDGNSVDMKLLNADPNVRYRIEFFSTSDFPLSRRPEAETFVSAVEATFEPDTVYSLSLGGALAAGNYLTATATNLTTGDTSGLSDMRLSGRVAFIVNMTGDERDANILDDVPDTDLDTPGVQATLRAAIEQANFSPGDDEIHFAIGGGVIQPTEVLPVIGETVTIDGTTNGSLVQLDGGNMPNDFFDVETGLTVNQPATRTEIRGLHITNFRDGGIQVYTDRSLIEDNVLGNNRGYGILLGSRITPAGIFNEIRGNKIGTDPTGTIAMPNNGGIWVFANDTVIGGRNLHFRNLISGNAGSQIHIRGNTLVDGSYGNANIVVGNYIGTDVTGENVLVGGAGVLIDGHRGGAHRNIIGGFHPNERNIISTHSTGISIVGFNAATNNRVFGNYIGTNKDGDKGITNSIGIQVGGVSGTEIGSRRDGGGNLISGNGRAGILLSGSTNTQIQGNLIGTDATGTQAIGNVGPGVLIDGASNNLIGGIQGRARNVIAHNQSAGVFVTGTAATTFGNQILRNSIHSNVRDPAQVNGQALGIDLFGGNQFGPPETLNDIDDLDVGPNQLQNFPQIEITPEGRISGRLNSHPTMTFRIEVFANDECDPTGFGEGQQFLTSFDVTTDGTGNVEFRDVFGAASTKFITATATDPNGNTSEFSPCAQAPEVPHVPIFISGAKYEDLEKNAIDDPTDVPLSDWEIHLDLHGDGATDGITFTDEAGEFIFPGLAVAKNQNLSAGFRENFNEGAVAVNPTDPNNVVALSNFSWTSGIYHSVTHDGGQTWVRSRLATGNNSFGRACCDASAAYDHFGNLFVTYIQTVAPRQGILLLSTNGGLSYRRIASYDVGRVVDQPTVTTGADSVWVTYRDGSHTISAFGATVNGLGSVTGFTRAQVAPNSSGGNFGDIAIGPLGQVAVAYQNPTSGEGPSNMQVHVDLDGFGAGPFSANRLVPVRQTEVGGFDVIPAQPDRSVDAEIGLAYDRSGGPHRGRLYMLYTDEIGAESDDLDVLLIHSDDDGATWSDPVRVNDDQTNRSQFLPKLAVDQATGLVGVAWHDARNDDGDFGPGDSNGIENDDVQLWASVSFDGGESFVPNVRVSQGTSNAKYVGNSMNFGDYIGLSFHNFAMYPTWADNSNSTNDNATGRFGRFNLYTSRISVVTLGTHTVSEVLPADYEQIVPGGLETYDVSVSPGIGASDLKFGNFRKGTIEGSIFLDLNNDGVRQPEEFGLSNWNVWLNPEDGDGDGEFETADEQVLSDARGNYQFEALDPGSYSVAQISVPGMIQSTPENQHTIEIEGLLSGETKTGNDFGLAPAMSIVRGAIFEDSNANGIREESEVGIPNRTVYIDDGDRILNNDVSGNGVCDDFAVDPCTYSDETGVYFFAGLPFGNYSIQVVENMEWRQTTGESVTFVDGQPELFEAEPIGFFKNAVLEGRVFFDFNGKGLGGPPKDSFSGQIAYVDRNGNGRLDHPNDSQNCDGATIEPCVITGEDGSFRFDRIVDPTAEIRVVVPPTFILTHPSTGAYSFVIETSGSQINGLEFGLHDPLPTASLVSPTAGSTIAIDSGFVEMEWLDASPTQGGILADTIGTGDIAMESNGTPLSIDRVIDLGDNRYRYVYADDGQALTDGAVVVTVVSGEVADLQGNLNIEQVFRLEFSSGNTVGDSNGDGIFDSSDLVAVFRAGEYEDGIPMNSTFAEGDWDGDGDFTTSDLVFAFAAGDYVPFARRFAIPLVVDAIFDETHGWIGT